MLEDKTGGPFLGERGVNSGERPSASHPRLLVPKFEIRNLQISVLSRPAIAAMQPAEPLLAYQLAWSHEKLGIVHRRVVRQVR